MKRLQYGITHGKQVVLPIDISDSDTEFATITDDAKEFMAVEDVNDPCASPSIRHLDAVVHKSLPESDSCPKESPEPTAKGSPKPGP